MYNESPSLIHKPCVRSFLKLCKINFLHLLHLYTWIQMWRHEWFNLSQHLHQYWKVINWRSHSTQFVKITLHQLPTTCPINLVDQCCCTTHGLIRAPQHRTVLYDMKSFQPCHVYPRPRASDLFHHLRVISKTWYQLPPCFDLIFIIQDIRRIFSMLFYCSLPDVCSI